MQDFCCPDESGRIVLTAQARNRIKMATRELRRLTGDTLEEAAVRSGISCTQWHNYENTAKPDLIPVHVYLPIELELGDAPVTRAIAAMSGLAVSSNSERASTNRAVELMASAAREQGEALAVLIEASADGKFSPNEAKTIAKEFGDVRNVADQIVNFAVDQIPGHS